MTITASTWVLLQYLMTFRVDQQCCGNGWLYISVFWGILACLGFIFLCHALSLTWGLINVKRLRANELSANLMQTLQAARDNAGNT